MYFVAFTGITKPWFVTWFRTKDSWIRCRIAQQRVGWYMDVPTKNVDILLQSSPMRPFSMKRARKPKHKLQIQMQTLESNFASYHSENNVLNLHSVRFWVQDFENIFERCRCYKFRIRHLGRWSHACQDMNIRGRHDKAVKPVAPQQYVASRLTLFVHHTHKPSLLQHGTKFVRTTPNYKKKKKKITTPMATYHSANVLSLM